MISLIWTNRKELKVSVWSTSWFELARSFFNKIPLMVTDAGHNQLLSTFDRIYLLAFPQSVSTCFALLSILLPIEKVLFQLQITVDQHTIHMVPIVLDYSLKTAFKITICCVHFYDLYQKLLPTAYLWFKSQKCDMPSKRILLSGICCFCFSNQPNLWLFYNYRKWEI